MINFRAIGYTDEAINYPLSPAGISIIAEHNGVSPDQLPEAARYSSGPYMHKWIEALGSARGLDRTVRDADGRWFGMSEL